MKSKFIILVLIYSFCPFIIIGQNLIYEKVSKKKFQKQPNVFEISSNIDEKVLEQFSNKKEVYFLEYNKNIQQEFGDAISIDIPMGDSKIVVQLVEVETSFYDYTITTSEGKSYYPNTKSKHYRGIVEGDAESIVAFSFFNNTVMGMILTNEGDFNIGSINSNNKLILYNDKNLKNIDSFECATEDDEINYRDDVLSSVSKRDINSWEKCVRFYFELEYDMYQYFGDVESLGNYVSGLFNQVALLYENENIKVDMVGMLIYTTSDPYTGTNTSTLLSQYQNNSVFNSNIIEADLGHLLTFRSTSNGGKGGKAAGFNGLCNSNPKNSLAVSMLHHTYQNVPNYSWNVNVITHEFGHLFGSRHTHACVWNGNNTAIDGCGPTAGYNEGCTGPIPSSGTIMSYCHLIGGVGINLNNGFGIQPGNVIRDNVENASCLDICNICLEDLTIDENVGIGGSDIQSASNTIIATNVINANATAEYDAGTSVTLKPGFYAKQGSDFLAYIEGCSSSEDRPGGIVNPRKSKSLSEDKTAREVSIYPNPVISEFTFKSDAKMNNWYLMDINGNVKLKGSLREDKLSSPLINIDHFTTGNYFLKVVFEDQKVLTKSIIKK